MFAFLLIVQALIAISLICVILMQRSEGGGLGVGGSSSGFMTARGAADFLTRSTAVLGGLGYSMLSIALLETIILASMNAVSTALPALGLGVGVNLPGDEKEVVAGAVQRNAENQHEGELVRIEELTRLPSDVPSPS